MVLVSCVLTTQGELLVVDHTDDGLSAPRPRSLGFLSPEAALPQDPERPLQVQALRRYAVVLPIYRTASRRRSGLMAGHGAADDPALFDSVETEDLRLFASSRSQYDALQRAITGWSDAANPQPEVVQIESEEDVFFIACEDDEDSDDQPQESVEERGEVLGDEEEIPAGNDDLHIGDSCEALQPEACSGPHQVMISSPRASLEDADKLAEADTSGSAGHCSQHGSPAYGAQSGSATEEVLAEEIRKRIANVRETILCSPPPPAVCNLLAVTAEEQSELHSAWVAAAEAAELSLSPFSTLKGLKGYNNSDIAESGRRLRVHLELRAGAVGLLAGLDTAMALEIRRFAVENARLWERLGQYQATDSSVGACESCGFEPIPATEAPAAEPVILSGMPGNKSFQYAAVPFSTIFSQYLSMLVP